jgi:hypothetical protein
MKRRSVAVLVAAALCLVVAAPVAAKDPVRPFGGWVAGVDSAAFDPTDCPAGWMIRYSSAGTGQLLHLGRVQFAVTHCVIMDSPVAGRSGPGTITIMAANGDTLLLTETGGTFTFDQPMPLTTTSDAKLAWVVAGGTGRFAGATGSGTGVGSSDMVAGTTVVSFTGIISY